MTVIAMPRFLGGRVVNSEQSYRFDEGDKRKAVKLSDDLNVLAKNVAKRNGDVEIVKTLLIEANNHTVQLQGELAKAEIAAEEADRVFWKEARKMMGVSDGEQE